MIAKMMVEINGNVSQKGVKFVRQFGDNYVKQFSQQYILEKGLKKFGERGKLAAEKELDQLHKRDVSNRSMCQPNLMKKRKRHKKA